MLLVISSVLFMFDRSNRGPRISGKLHKTLSFSKIALWWPYSVNYMISSNKFVPIPQLDSQEQEVLLTSP